MEIRLKNGQLIYTGMRLEQNEIEQLLSDHEQKPTLADVAVKWSADELADMTQQHIYRHYPQVKQASDTADKMFFETTMRASGNYPNLDADIARAVADYYTAHASGTPTTVEAQAQVLAVNAADADALAQLIKVGIRVKWVQDCKAAFRAAVAELEAGGAPTLSLPDYPL